METINLTLFVSIVVPMLLAMLICRGRSRICILFVIIGMLVCLFTGEINTILIGATNISLDFYAVNISPLIEEFFKSVPLFLYAYILRPKRQALLQSAVSLGVGFAILENVVVIAKSGGMIFMDALIRSFGSGLMHAVATLWIGCGITLVYLNRKLFYTGSFALLITASIFHSIYNALIGSEYMIAGLLLPISTLIPMLWLIAKRGMHQNNVKKSPATKGENQ